MVPKLHMESNYLFKNWVFGFQIVVGSLSIFLYFFLILKNLTGTWSELAYMNRYRYSYSVGTNARPAIDTYLNRLSGRLARSRPRPPPIPPPRNLIPGDRYRYSYWLENCFYLQIQPYIHNYCNNMADRDQLTAITFPDVDPNMLPEDSKQVFITVFGSDLFIYFNLYICHIRMFSFFFLLISRTSVRNLKREQFFKLFSYFLCIPLNNELITIEGWVRIRKSEMGDISKRVETHYSP